jgi:outer membrane protein assembly factor BamB
MKLMKLKLARLILLLLPLAIGCASSKDASEEDVILTADQMQSELPNFKWQLEGKKMAGATERFFATETFFIKSTERITPPANPQEGEQTTVELSAYEISSGKKAWTQTIQFANKKSFDIKSSNLYLAIRNEAGLVLLDVATGKKQFELSTAAFKEKMKAADAKVSFVRLLAFDLNDAAVAVSVSDEYVALLSPDGDLRKTVKLDDGAIVSRFDLTSNVCYVANINAMMVGGDKNTLAKIDLTDSKNIWTLNAPMNEYTLNVTPSVVFGFFSDNLWGINTATGKALWQKNLRGSRLLSADDNVIEVKANSITAYVDKTFKKRWTFKTKQAIKLEGKTQSNIYVAADGKIFFLSPQTGKLVKSIELKNTEKLVSILASKAMLGLVVGDDANFRIQALDARF